MSAKALDHLELAPTTQFTPRDLRAAGEAAEGVTGKNLVVVWNAENQLEVKEEGASEGDRVVVRLYAEPDVPGRSRPASVSFTPSRGSSAEELVDRFDAVFWSEGAFKKFLFSYYHGMRLLTREGMARLHRAYASSRVVAFAHDPKSVPTLLGDDAILDSLYVFRTRDGAMDAGGEWLKVTDPRLG